MEDFIERMSELLDALRSVSYHQISHTPEPVIDAEDKEREILGTMEHVIALYRDDLDK